MAKKLDIGALMGGVVSKLDTMQVEEIALDLIDENPGNRYAQSDIADLAESIQVIGLQQPLVVQADDSRYLLLAGHRRKNALVQLGRMTAPCVVFDAELDPAIRTLILHWTNTMARGGAGLTGGELAATAKEIEAALVDLKQRGVIDLPGKLREYVAGVLQVSESALARAKVIEQNLNVNFKRKYQNWQINDSAAYELSQCDEELQRKLYAAYEKHLHQLDAKHVKAHRKAALSGFAPLTCPAENYSVEPCAGTDKRAAAVKRGECPGCCHDCDKSESCEWVCGKISKKQTAARNESERRREADEKNEQFRASSAGKAYAHAREVLEQFGYSAENMPGEINRWTLSGLWTTCPAQTSMPSMKALSDAAEAIGITLQELLFDTPDGEQLRQLSDAVQGAVSPALAWHPYPDEQPGENVTVLVCKIGSGGYLYRDLIYRGHEWYLPELPDAKMNVDVKWWSTSLAPT